MSDEQREYPIADDQVNYVCPRCLQEFETLFQYNRHLREEHDERLAPLAV